MVIAKFCFSNFLFSAPHSSPQGQSGDMRLIASVRDYKNLDLEGSFDLLALPQPELYKIYERGGGAVRPPVLLGLIRIFFR